MDAHLWHEGFNATGADVGIVVIDKHLDGSQTNGTSCGSTERS